MTKSVGRNINTNDTANVTTYTLNPTESIVIAPANPNRIFLHVSTDGANTQGAWLRLYPSSVDNLKQGIYLPEKQIGNGSWNMPADNIYTGEISAISNVMAVNIHVTEY